VGKRNEAERALAIEGRHSVALFSFKNRIGGAVGAISFREIGQPKGTVFM